MNECVFVLDVEMIMVVEMVLEWLLRDEVEDCSLLSLVRYPKIVG
jgi:hypothetical protein